MQTNKSSILSKLTEMTLDSQIFGKCLFYNSQDSSFLLQPSTGATLLVAPKLGQHIIDGGHEDELLKILSARGFSIDNVIKNPNNEKKIDPRFFMIDFTKSCNNRCTYCFRKLQKAEYIDSAILNNIIAKIIEYCKEYNIKKISLQPWGGEPLLAWKSIFQMHDMLNNAGIDVRILIETNGSSITSEIAKELYIRNILCSVSIDGPAFIHNQNRLLINGKGSYNTSIRGFNLLREAGYGNKIGVVCVITRNSLTHLHEIVDFFVKELKISRVKMNIVKDSSQMSDKSLCLKPEDISYFWEQLLNKLISINENCISFGENTIIAMLHNLTTQRPMSFCHSRGCQSGYRMLSFGMDGGIYPCDLTDYPELKLGNISSTDGLKTIVSHQMQSHPFLKLQLPDKCSDCNWKIYCGGGCKSMRLYNKRNEPDQADCIRNNTLYPLLINLIINKPKIIKSLTGGEISIT